MKIHSVLAFSLSLMSVSQLSVSCNKENTDNNSDKIVGSWELMYEAADLNHDGKLDEQEKDFVRPGSYTYFKFQKDGTLIDSLDRNGVTGVHYGRYTISGQQAFLSILGRSITYNILKLDASNLKVKENDTPGNWFVFGRQ